MKTHNLDFRGGPGAIDIVRREGFSPELIGTIAGASGGAKWLVLSQLDRVILESVVPNLKGPVHLIGTSIGAWRFACYAQNDPLAALNRFEEAYISQAYSESPDIHEITAKSREILGKLLGPAGVAEILDHPIFRTHVLAVRARHMAATDQGHALGVALLMAASFNALSRRLLGLFFERALFFDARDLPPFFDMDGFPLQKIMMRRSNLEDAIIATGSIPMVLSGVRDIEGAMPGVYRDGGVIDYHLDFPHSEPGRLTLYPHFINRMIPGWFDKRFGWRRPDPINVDRTILISPSAEFVANLPKSKIPDRTDFRTFAPGDRMRIWRQVVSECERLADELREVLEAGEIGSRLRPIQG